MGTGPQRGLQPPPSCLFLSCSKCIKYTLMTPKLYPACRVQGKELMSVRAGRVSCFLLGVQNRRCYPGTSTALVMVVLSAVVTDLPETSVSLASRDSADLVSRLGVPSKGFSFEHFLGSGQPAFIRNCNKHCGLDDSKSSKVQRQVLSVLKPEAEVSAGPRWGLSRNLPSVWWL